MRWTCVIPSRSPPWPAGTATGADVAARMPLLSAFMGHAGPASTFYYLHAAPELLALAAQRLHDHQQQDRKEEP